MLRFVLVATALVALSRAESSHKVFRITAESDDQLELLRNLDNDIDGFSFWKSPSVKSQFADLMVAPEKLSNFSALMSSKNIKYESLIDDVEALLEVESNRSRSRAGSFGWRSYHDLEEIYSWLDSLAERYPDNIETIVGGRTYEGREIKGVKLSFGEESKPGVFIEGGIHAREWISQATVTYLLNQFLNSQEPSIRSLAESYDWYIFPVFNPDGYAYTHINPRNVNYRFWRKTRSPNHDSMFPFPMPGGCLGADMNRNWGFQWNTRGASSNPCSEAYAGSAPFSTVEAKTMSRYISSISDKLFAYIAFHSYSQFLMVPYGHTRTHLDNYDEGVAIARKAVTALSKRFGTHYKVGSIGEVIGLASGGSVDWVKAKLKLPLVYIYELRDRGNSGFVLPPSQIIPNGQEVMDSLIALFKEAKQYGYPSES